MRGSLCPVKNRGIVEYFWCTIIRAFQTRLQRILPVVHLGFGQDMSV